MKPSIYFILAALFFLSATQLFAQSDFGLNARSSFEVVAGGGEGYRQLVGNEIAARNEREVPGPSWMVGVKTSRRISNQLWFGLGVNFTNVNYRTQNLAINGSTVCSTPVFGGVGIPDLGDVFLRVPNVGLVITPSTRTDCFSISEEEGQHRQILFNSQHIEIPLTLRYELGQFRFRPFIEMGLTGSYLIRNTVRAKNGREVVKAARQQLERRNRFGLGGVLSIGAAYGLNENISVFAQPVYRYSFSSTGITSDAEMGEFSRSLMLQVGIRKDIL
ncbi:MAG: outer membrane beta-barrel protein [Lewinella sp.]